MAGVKFQEVVVEGVLNQKFSETALVTSAIVSLLSFFSRKKINIGHKLKTEIFYNFTSP